MIQDGCGDLELLQNQFHIKHECTSSLLPQELGQMFFFCRSRVVYCLLELNKVDVSV